MKNKPIKQESEIVKPENPILDLYTIVMADCSHKMKAMKKSGAHKTDKETYKQLKVIFKNASDSWDELYLELQEKLNG